MWFFSTPALKLYPIYYCLRWSGFLVYFTQCERCLIACGWAKAGDLQTLQLLSYGCVVVKWVFVFQPVSPYSEKWPLCFHVSPLKWFSVLLRFSTQVGAQVGTGSLGHCLKSLLSMVVGNRGDISRSYHLVLGASRMNPLWKPQVFLQ